MSNPNAAEDNVRPGLQALKWLASLGEGITA
jgi:hypothetical protein